MRLVRLPRSRPNDPQAAASDNEEDFKQGAKVAEASE